MVFRLASAASAIVVVAALGACARAPLIRPPVTVPEPLVATPGRTASPDGEAIAGAALALVGTAYRNGGSDPAGFDCSGFVQYVFAERGIRLPRGVDEQFHAGRPVAASAVSAGDLLFFATTGAGPSHVGIAIGAGAFVHAPSTNGRVRVERVGAPYWAQRFVGARRVAADSGLTPR